LNGHQNFDDLFTWGKSFIFDNFIEDGEEETEFLNGLKRALDFQSKSQSARIKELEGCLEKANKIVGSVSEGGKTYGFKILEAIALKEEIDNLLNKGE